MGKVKFDCKCPPKDRVENWLPLDPSESRHSWRVQCLGCDKFLKWGSEAEYNRRIAEGETLKTVYPKPSATLDEFFE